MRAGTVNYESTLHGLNKALALQNGYRECKLFHFVLKGSLYEDRLYGPLFLCIHTCKCVAKE